jgi:hypothetical protein
MKDRLSRPVLTEATDITDHSFTANWLPVEGAKEYALEIREILPDSINPIVLDEDFSLMQDEDYPKSSIEEISKNLNDYCHVKGWTGEELYASNGYVRVGSYGKSGRITTPEMDLTDNEGVFTVAFKAISYPGKKVSYTVSHTNSAGIVFNTFDLKADKNEQFVRLVFDGGTENSKISFSTKNERLFINDIRIVKGDVDSMGVVTAGPKGWRIDDIADTKCLVDGLVLERTYYYKVFALATEGMTGSLPSAEQQVTTAYNTAVEKIIDSGIRKIISVRYYDVTGRLLSKPSEGVTIRHITYSDGSQESVKLVRMSKDSSH